MPEGILRFARNAGLRPAATSTSRAEKSKGPASESGRYKSLLESKVVLTRSGSGTPLPEPSDFALSGTPS